MSVLVQIHGHCFRVNFLLLPSSISSIDLLKDAEFLTKVAAVFRSFARNLPRRLLHFFMLDIQGIFYFKVLIIPFLVTVISTLLFDILLCTGTVPTGTVPK
jgi:hypothetical protein